jgi:hypothetical protein
MIGMYKVGDVKRKARKRLQRRIIASAAIIGVMVLSYFLIYNTGLFGSDELTTGTITSVKSVPDDLPAKTGIFDTTHRPENEVIIPKDSPVVTVFDGDNKDEVGGARKEEVADNNREVEGIKSGNAVNKREAVAPADENRRVVLKSPEDDNQRRRSVRTKERVPGAVYEVLSEAYLYNRPSEQARSKAYISYWNNSNGSIKSLRERNGFVYVECKDNLGQTAQGWLRKKDLKQVSTVYEATKE